MVLSLGEVVAGSGILSVSPETDLNRPCRGLEYDSRRVTPGDVFFAIVGAAADGRRFAAGAVAAGAVAVVSDAPAPEGSRLPWIQVAHTRRGLAAAARRVLGAPDDRLGLTGVTGTNGKTTTTYLIDAVLRAAGAVTARIGTTGYDVAGTVEPAVNTTPESLEIYRMLDRTVQAGGRYATMEVSSHALAQGRVAGMQFHTAVFTNLTQDHLDFHGTMEAYFEAKRSLFTSDPAPRFAVIHGDDAYGRRIEPAAGTAVLRFGLSEEAELRATGIESTFAGLRFTVRHEGRAEEIRSPLVGEINVLNILAALGTGLSYGLDWETLRRGIAGCAGVPGRFERVDAGQPFLVAVDYAHTDDALRNTISVARRLLAGTAGRVVTLFGCGGDRDRTKRPKMGAAAAEGSDFVVVTSDNPRSEEPGAILDDILAGMRGTATPVRVEPDRAAAIRLAIGGARAGDIVILAGKGHETYQILKDRTIAFDDRAEAREALRADGYGGAA